MSDLFKDSEYLKPYHYNYMAWRSLLAVDAHEKAIGNEHYPPIGNAAAIRAQQQDLRKRVGKGAVLGASADNSRSQISYIDDLHEIWEALEAKHDTEDSYEARLIVPSSCVPQEDRTLCRTVQCPLTAAAGHRVCSGQSHLSESHLRQAREDRGRI